jgi:primosomal protein N' (replication factor Y)
MVEHRFLKRLVCHQCGETKPLPEVCPVCGVEGKMAAVGPGVERVARRPWRPFPDAKIAVLSSDLFGSARALKAQIEEIAEGDTDIIIGTQLVAKGHNFPRLTLVGVVDADLGLQGGPARGGAHVSADAAGGGARGAGRQAGVALMQTFQPEHPVIRAILGATRRRSGAPRRRNGRRRGCRPTGGWPGSSSARATRPRPSISAASGAERRGDPRGGRRGLRSRAGAHRAGPRSAPGAACWSRRPRARRSRPRSAVGSAGIKLPSQVRLSVDIDPQSFY